MRWRASLVAALGLLALTGSRGVPLPERWTEARAGWLYRSAQIRADDVESVLRAQQIDLVIDLTDEPQRAARDAEQRAARALGIRYLHEPVPPEHDVAVRSYAEAVAEIARAPACARLDRRAARGGRSPPCHAHAPTGSRSNTRRSETAGPTRCCS